MARRQNATEWAPAPRQARVLAAAQEAGLNRNIVGICAAAGVHRGQFYRWMEKDPNFRDAWENIWRGALKRHMPGVISAMIAKALDGDVQAARLLADMAGEVKESG